MGAEYFRITITREYETPACHGRVLRLKGRQRLEMIGKKSIERYY